MASHADLASIGAQMVRTLGGHWRHDRGLCRCPSHDDKAPSLSVRVGDRNLLFKCFAGCATVDVLKALRALGLAVPQVSDAKKPEILACAVPLTNDLVKPLWSEARPLAGSLGARYLGGRGLNVCPPALRFHPLTPIGRSRRVRFRPAILAAVVEGERVRALQRIFLDPNGAGLSSELSEPRVTLGSLGSGSVRLSPAGSELGLAEGIETALSGSALLGIPVWASLGSGRLHALVIPQAVRRVILLPDNDRAGRVASARAATVYAAQGFDVGVEWPPFGLNDWNDVLRQFETKKRRGKEWGG